MRLLTPALLLLSLGGAAAFLLAARAEQPAVAQSAPRLPKTEVAVVVTAHDAGARWSEVRFVSIDAAGAHARVLGSLPHAPGAFVRGDVLRGTRSVVVTADPENAARSAERNDWASVLYLLDESGKTTVLASGLYHASRPLASSDGAVYVERGTTGASPSAEEARRGRLRTDTLEIDAVDPKSGAVRVVYSWSGYTLHLCGELRSELVVYRVAFEGADIVAIDRASGRSRLVAALPPFARDFSVDEKRGALVLTERDANDAALWAVERVDLTTGARTRLNSERDDTPAAFAFPDGRTAWTGAKRTGLVFADKNEGEKSARLAPFGAGFDKVENVSADGAWILLSHLQPGSFDVTAAVHLASGTPVRLTAGDERVDALGFVGGSNGGAR